MPNFARTWSQNTTSTWQFFGSCRPAAFRVVRPSRAAHHDVLLLAALDEISIVSMGEIVSQEIQGKGDHHEGTGGDYHGDHYEGTGGDDHGDTPGGALPSITNLPSLTLTSPA